MVTPSMQLIGEALAEVASISVDEALALVDGGDAVFVDVRERAEHDAGAIAGAVAAPRGFLEFVADPRLADAQRRALVRQAAGDLLRLRRALRARRQDVAGHGVFGGREPHRRLPGLDRGRRPHRMTQGASVSTTAS